MPALMTSPASDSAAAGGLNRRSSMALEDIFLIKQAQAPA